MEGFVVAPRRKSTKKSRVNSARSNSSKKRSKSGKKKQKKTKGDNHEINAKKLKNVRHILQPVEGSSKKIIVLNN
tara:strand:+ start:3109 stop:3333 length:225 start_codon:yes stop_codon:yes gene_type:complete